MTCTPDDCRCHVVTDHCPQCHRLTEWELIGRQTGQCSRCGCVIRDGVVVLPARKVS